MILDRLPRPLAFVFTAGAARTASQVGMLKVLTDFGVTPDLVVGSSTGAINAAIYASEPDFAPDSLESMWNAVANDSALSSTWRTAVRGLTGTQSTRTATSIRGYVEGIISDQTFAKLQIPLTLIATDLDTGQGVALSEGRVSDAVMASSAFPVLLPPVEFHGDLLVDGSVSAAAPVLAAARAGAKSIILLDTGSSRITDEQAQSASWYAIMAFAFSHLVRGRAAHELADIARTMPVVVLSCDQGAPLDLKSAPTLIHAGELVASKGLKQLIKSPDTTWKPGIYGHTHGLAADHRISGLIRKP